VSERGATPVERLVRLLEPRSLGSDVFEAWTGEGAGRLFGGLVAAQAVVAAGHTVSERGLHSLHAYFLRPGKQGVLLRLLVDRIREGRTFATRQVVVEQDGEAIFTMSASFARSETGISHQDPMPDAPDPDGLPDWEDVRATILGDPSERRPEQPIEIRACDPDSSDPDLHLPPLRRVWMRPRGPIPEDPLLHAALLVYASDRTLAGTIARPHGLTWGRRVAASLDHAVWLHRPVRFDDWILYVTSSPAAHAARGIVFGAMYSRDGTRIASVAQEGLVRIPRGTRPRSA
jgi:acyl-CoA thioesterase-2